MRHLIDSLLKFEDFGGMKHILFSLKHLGLILLFSLKVEAGPTKTSLDICQATAKAINKLSDSEKLKILLETQWKTEMSESPESATDVGVSGYNHLWTDRSAAAREMRKKLNQCYLKTFQGIAKDKLGKDDQLTFELALKKLNENKEQEKFFAEYMLFDQMSGFQLEIADLLFAAPKEKTFDYEDRLKRLKSAPIAIQQQIDLMREGLKQKITPVRFLIEKVPAQIDVIIPLVLEESPLYKAILEMPNSFPEKFREDTLKEARAIIETEVYPAFQKLRQFLVKEYIPKCRKDIAWSSMPKGAEWYAFLARIHTTTNLKPQEIYDLGISEVQRIKSEMEKVRDQVKFKGNTKDFHDFLRTSPQFFFEKSKDLISVYRDIAKRIDPELPRLFGQLPRLSYGIREMPAYKAPNAPTAYYMPGSGATGRAGYFEANTYQLTSRPKWEMEVLTSHEAVPGHHLQISLAQEMGELPEFRKHGRYTAFTEGWGLYAESLGEELGLYVDPYSKYGQLSYEMWRAVRLVVDTGMHMKSWSKEKALDYFMEHVPKDRLQAENEIDRYITWPGQALSYKIGQLKFLELKSKAQKSLKDRFNIREFHDEVLRHGSLPMDVLEKLFAEWLIQQKRKIETTQISEY